MDRAEEASIIFENVTGLTGYIRREDLDRKKTFSDGLFTRELLNKVLEQYDYMKSQKKEFTSKDIVDTQLYQVKMASYLGEIKGIITEEKTTEIKL